MGSGLWLGLGLIAGGLVSLIYDEPFKATIRNILFGVAGSIIGGGLMTSWDNGRLSTIDFYAYGVIFTLVSSLALIALAKIRQAVMTDNFTPLNKNKFNKTTFSTHKNNSQLLSPGVI